MKMKQQDLYTIGEVCRICNVNASMLRYYDDIGLVKPQKVDGETGYRYYGNETLLDLPVIYYLKVLGFSLKEIKALSLISFELQITITLIFCKNRLLIYPKISPNGIFSEFTLSRSSKITMVLFFAFFIAVSLLLAAFILSAKL